MGLSAIWIPRQEYQRLLLSSSHEPDHTDAGRSIRERHPITGIDGGSGLFKVKNHTGVTAYQTEFIDIGVLAQVLGQGPIGHPMIYDGEWRVIGAKSKETDHIWM